MKTIYRWFLFNLGWQKFEYWAGIFNNLKLNTSIKNITRKRTSYQNKHCNWMKRGYTMQWVHEFKQRDLKDCQSTNIFMQQSWRSGYLSFSNMVCKCKRSLFLRIILISTKFDDGSCFVGCNSYLLYMRM
jgi:hypothetical protein